MVESSLLIFTAKISSTDIRSAILPRSSKEYGARLCVLKLLVVSCCSQCSKKDLIFFSEAVNDMICLFNMLISGDSRRNTFKSHHTH